MKRQNIRKCMLIVSLLLFPITMYYFSPYVIIAGAMNGIIAGSFITFVLLILAGIIFGRGFCAYVCPAGGMAECALMVNDTPVKNGKGNYIKYIIWIIWLAVIIACFIIHGSIEKVEPAYMTDHGISISEIGGYIIYYLVIGIIIVPCIIAGRRAFCHWFCWMAPFMVTGMKIRKLLHLPGLRIKAEKDQCIHCGQCTKHCPMSLPVEELVKGKEIGHTECLNCGQCIDHCPKKVLSYTMKQIKETN